MVKDWEYYNHAWLPTTAPHVEPDTSWMKQRKMWRRPERHKGILLARWTTDFDCGHETGWWYIIKDAPFDLEELERHSRKHIRQALNRCRVERIDPGQCVEDLFRVYEEAYARYQNADNRVSYEQFRTGCLEEEGNVHYWAGYDLSGRMIGYVTVITGDTYAEISSAKFSPEYMHLRVSDALYYTILDYYLNKDGKDYISSGERSINHVTNTQEYKIRTFGFRKAYCRLHIKYNPMAGWIVRMLYPTRRLLRKFDKNRLMHQVISILNMEEIRRADEKLEKESRKKRSK